jgi:TRAP-type transport system small permease protein
VHEEREGAAAGPAPEAEGQAGSGGGFSRFLAASGLLNRGARPVSDPGAPLWRRAFDHLEEMIAAAALAVIVLAVSWGVFTRYVLRESAPWTGEVAAIGFAWLIFLGASACFRREMHIGIDALVNLLPAGLRRSLASVVDLLVIVFCAYVCWLAIGFAITTHATPTSVLRWPQSVTYSAPAVGFAFMTLRVTQHAWRRLRQQEP